MMTTSLLEQLDARRRARDHARDTYRTHMAAFQADMADRGLGGRIVDEVSEQARVLLDEAVDVAEEHPGVVGGTIAAVMVWLLRNPIMAWVEEWLGPPRRR